MGEGHREASGPAGRDRMAGRGFRVEGLCGEYEVVEYGGPSLMHNDFLANEYKDNPPEWVTLRRADGGYTVRVHRSKRFELVG